MGGIDSKIFRPSFAPSSNQVPPSNINITYKSTTVQSTTTTPTISTPFNSNNIANQNSNNGNTTNSSRTPGNLKSSLVSSTASSGGIRSGDNTKDNVFAVSRFNNSSSRFLSSSSTNSPNNPALISHSNSSEHCTGVAATAVIDSSCDSSNGVVITSSNNRVNNVADNSAASTLPWTEVVSSSGDSGVGNSAVAGSTSFVIDRSINRDALAAVPLAKDDIDLILNDDEDVDDDYSECGEDLENAEDDELVYESSSHYESIATSTVGDSGSLVNSQQGLGAVGVQSVNRGANFPSHSIKVRS